MHNFEKGLTEKVKSNKPKFPLWGTGGLTHRCTEGFNSCNSCLNSCYYLTCRPNLKLPDMLAVSNKYDAIKYKTPTGSQLNCKGWIQEAALRMLLNNLDPEVAERPDDLI